MNWKNLDKQKACNDIATWLIISAVIIFIIGVIC